MLSIKIFQFNAFQENTFVLYDEAGDCVIIDAGCYSSEEKEELTNFIEGNGLRPVKLLNTHCHIDHVLGNSFVCSRFGIESWANEFEKPILGSASTQGQIYGLTVDDTPAIKHYIQDNEIISVGNAELKALHVPGHSPGSIAYYNEKGKFVITGDALFNGSIGRTDFPGGNHATLITSIKNKLLSLNNETTVYPGHGPSTTIGWEKQNNPFLK